MYRLLLRLSILSSIIFSNSFSYSQLPEQVEIVIQPGPEDGNDAYINSVYKDRNGDTPSFIASAWSYYSSEGIGRSFIRFDLPELPAYYDNFSAVINFYHDPNSSHAGHYGENECKLERVIEEWIESEVSWFNQPEVTEQNSVILPTSTSAEQDYLNINITDLIMDIYQNPNTSFGLRLSLTSEIITRSMILASSDNDIDTLRPMLIIRYNTCKSPQNLFSTHVENFTCQFSYLDSTTTSWQWDFGDGFGSTQKNPVHTYSSPGLYNVNLTVTNDCNTLIIIDTIRICGELVPSFDYTLENFVVQFVNQSPSGLLYHWDLGQGMYSNLQNPIYNFKQPGTYIVCLEVSNICETVTVCDTIIISEFGGGLGWSKISTDKEIKLFPNPASTDIWITTQEITLKSIDLFNIQGVPILSTTCLTNENKINLSLKDLISGVYLIKLNSNSGIFWRKLIVFH